MNIGLGTTLLTRSKQSGQLDGIATYTQQLLQELSVAQIEISQYDFLTLTENIALGKFIPQSLLSAMTGRELLTASKIEQQVDLFHATDHHIPKLRDIPVVATIMDTIPLEHPEWLGGNYKALKKRFFKKSAQWAQHIITISDYSANAISEHFNIPKEKITAIPLGVDECCYQRVSQEKKKEVRDRYHLPKNYFLCIGTLQPRKNIERLITAFLQLPQEMQNEHPLVIIGRAGWGCEKLVKKLHNLKGIKPVVWLDYVPSEDKYALLQSSLALIFPSLYEGFGLPILEAFAANTPVISSNVTALPEVAGDAAILIDPYSTESIADAMQKIATDNALKDDLQSKGQERVKVFSWKNTAEQTQQVYQRLL